MLINKKQILLALSVVLVFFVSLDASAKNVIKAEVDKTKINTGEVFTYTLYIEGNFLKPKLTLPKFKNFEIISQSQRQNYVFKNNKLITTFNFVATLMATEAGNFVIEEAVLEDEDKTFKSESFTIEVKGEPLKKKKKPPITTDMVEI